MLIRSIIHSIQMGNNQNVYHMTNDKIWYSQTMNGMLFNIKKEEILTHATM